MGAATALFGVAYGLNQKAKPATCAHLAASHLVSIQQDTLSPPQISGQLCDQLTIVNRDNVTRLIAFGRHDHHTPYDGVEEKILRGGQHLTVTMNRRGTFLFHDHLHDEVAGSFTVN